VTDLHRERELLVSACRHLAARGLSPGGSGSLSVRVGDELLVTPTGSSCSRVRPDELARRPVAGDSVDAADPAADGTAPRPSKELGLHRAVYATRPDAAAVVHLHAHFTVAVACLESISAGPDGTGPMPAVTPYQVLRLGRLPVVPYAPPGSSELTAAVAAVAPAHPVLLLANHGSVVAAADLGRAVDLAEELEAAARLHFTLAPVAHRVLSAAQVAQLRR
jgi:ribulose-5-phosphate 4-epimerase/fuculose-1-phosphate aldolase